MKKETLINKQSIHLINEAWRWKGVKALAIVESNEFGNIIFFDEKKAFYRICPEELSLEKISDSPQNFEKLRKGKDFRMDWEMTNLVEMARDQVGTLSEKEKYCFKIPAVLGGEYSSENLGKIKFDEQIRVSGDLAKQIRDMKDGQKIKFEIKNRR